MRTDDLYLVDILDAAEAIGSFLRGARSDEFDRDEEKYSAVLWQLMIIGEAATKISPQTRDAFAAVPWGAIGRFRNLLVHGYFAVKSEQVWRIATDEVPRLREQAEKILATQFPETYRSRRGSHGGSP